MNVLNGGGDGALSLTTGALGVQTAADTGRVCGTCNWFEPENDAAGHCCEAPPKPFPALQEGLGGRQQVVIGVRPPVRRIDRCSYWAEQQ